MAKSISQIKNEISNFYLSIQNEITDVSTGSVAGGLIYAFSAALQSLYEDLESVESQAYIATATGRYLDLLIEGGFFLTRPGATRSRGYVLVYGDNPLVNPEETGSSLICADFDEETGVFLSGLSSATKFTGVNSSGSGSVTYALVKPKNTFGFKTDSSGNFVIDLRNKQAKYLVLPVVSVLPGSQTNVAEGSLNTFTNPPPGLRYVLNTNNPAEVIFDSPGISSAPLYSRTTSSNSLSQNGIFSVVNAFNFSSSGFLEISFKSFSPTNNLTAVYRNEFDEEISAGLVFEYSDKTQTSIKLKNSESYINNFSSNELSKFDLINFTYNSVTYSVDSSDVWTANQGILLEDGTPIGPSTEIIGSNEFFAGFFGNQPWVIRQRAEQISEDILFDPDSALSPDTYVLKEAFRLTTARDSFSDNQYRRFFKNYINSLPRATSRSLEFAASRIPGISFAKTLPSDKTPVGTAVLLAADENGVLPLSQKQNVINALKDDWVAAGIDLIVRPPDLLNFSMAVNISLTNDNLESFVRGSITEAVQNYLSSLQPGNEVKYGQIYSIITSIDGVKNVSKLIIGQNNFKHYEDYQSNYSKVVLEKAVDYNKEEFSFYETSTFKEPSNEIVITSDINGITVTPIQFSQYENFLASKNIFSKFNETVYGAVFGIFASDGGGSINASNYTTTVYSELCPPQNPTDIYEDATLGLRFDVNATDAAISITVNGDTFISSDVSQERVLFIPVSNVSEDVLITFAQQAGVTISNIQTFLHSEIIDTCLIAEISSLQQLSFIKNSKIEFIYDVIKKSNRIKNVKTIAVESLGDFNKLLNLFTSLVVTDKLSVFQTVLRDYQYGKNTSGKNPEFFKDLFVDTSKSDENFRHFLVYATTSPFSSTLDAFYPLTPATASNDLLSDYTLSSTEISRFKQLAVRLTARPTPALGILVE